MNDVQRFGAADDARQQRERKLRQEPFRVLSFNIYVGQPPDRARRNLQRLTDDLDYPHVLCLQEAKRFSGRIDSYRRLAVDPGDRRWHAEANSSIVLYREDVDLHRRFVLYAGGPDWIGPKHSIVHGPRTFVGGTFSSPDTIGRWDVLDVHRTAWGLSRNQGAYSAEDRRIVRWADSRARKTTDRPLGIFGDWNSRGSDPRRMAVSDLADRIGAKPYLRGIDGGLLRNVRHATARKLDEHYGSDHRPVMLQMWRLGDA